MRYELLEILIEKKTYRKTIYTKNEIILNNIRLSKKIYHIEKGTVKITHITKEGEELILFLLVENQVFGAVMCGDYHPCITSKSISKKTIIYEFDFCSIEEVIKNNMNIHKKYLFLLRDGYSELENRIRILSIRSAEQRLVNTLLEFHQKFEKKTDRSENIIIDSPINQDELATYIRTSRVTTNNIISLLKKKLLIDYNKKHIILRKEFFNYYNVSLKEKSYSMHL